jgi:RNA polymerase sigma factor (sigma-70 family)
MFTFYEPRRRFLTIFSHLRRGSRDDRAVRPDRFERLYREHRDGLFAFVMYRTGNRAVAEDLVGDVFERALRAHARFDPRRGSETTWLYAIALNRLRDHQRRAMVEHRAFERVRMEQSPAADAPDDRLAERDRVMQTLRILSPDDRELVALRFGADLTAPQIAKVTRKPLTTVEGRLYRALRRLKAALEAEPAVSGLPETPVEPVPRVRKAPVTAERSDGWSAPATGLVAP